VARHASPRSVGRIRDLVRSWALYLRAINRSPRTIQSDQEAALQFDACCTTTTCPWTRPRSSAATSGRGWRICWNAGRRQPRRPRYRSLRQFFRWLEEDGELAVSPKAKMRPAAGA
jgi:hypothetical protein